MTKLRDTITLEIIIDFLLDPLVLGTGATRSNGPNLVVDSVVDFAGPSMKGFCGTAQETEYSLPEVTSCFSEWHVPQTQGCQTGSR